MHPSQPEGNYVSVTLTIKQVPDRLAEGLRRRAAVNRRSQQQELILLLERAIDDSDVAASGVSEPAGAVYKVSAAHADNTTRQPRKSGGQGPRKLDLDALWRRARKLGARMPSESSAIVRADRDARRR